MNHSLTAKQEAQKMAITEDDQIVIDRLKRATKALSIAVSDAVEAGINVEVEIVRAQAFDRHRLIGTAPFFRLTVSKEAFVVSIPE